MTQTIYLVAKGYPQYGALLVNGVTAVLVNADSSANAVANAVLACNAAYQVTEGQSEANNTPQDAFGPNYFDTTNSNDTVTAVSSGGGVPGSGDMSGNGDAFVFAGPATSPVFVAGTSYSPVS